MRPNPAARSSSVSYVGALVTVAAFAWACGGRSSLAVLDGARPGDAGPSDGASLGLFVERLAAAACDAVAPCCNGAGLAHDAKTCRLMMVSRLEGRVPAATSPFVAYDAAAEEACLLAVAQVVNRCRGPSVYWGFTSEPVRSACLRALHGTKPVGAPCATWDECDQLAGTTGCAQERCTLWPTPVAPPPAGGRRIGESCRASSNLEACGSDCEVGSFCDSDGRCAARRGSGPCADLCHDACGGLSYCDPTSFTCRSRVPLGGACATYDACQGPDTICLSGTCVPSLLDLCTSDP